MRQKESKASLGNIGVLLVFCVLALSLLMTLLMGARIYRSITARAEQAGDNRTVSQYVTNRIRQADSADRIRVEDFEGVDALVIREIVNNTAYLTRIYCYDGWLYELFTAEGSGLSPEDGEQLIPVQGISFSLEDRLLTARIVHSDGSDQTLMLHLRSAQEVLP